MSFFKKQLWRSYQIQIKEISCNHIYFNFSSKSIILLNKLYNIFDMLIIIIVCFHTYRLCIQRYPIAIIASPMVLNVPTLTGFVLRVIEVTIVASPAILHISTFACLVSRVKPPVLFKHSRPTTFHVISLRITHMATCARPIVLNIVAF